MMTATPFRRRASGRGPPVLVVLALILPALWQPSPALGGDEAPNGPYGPLDGRSFSGDFGPQGRPADRSDTIHFDDGKVWSEACVPCGFAPAPYWVRHEGDAIHVRAELHSPTSGTFVYQGVVRDGQITARMSWQKDRWYWSMSRDFWFEGALAEVDGRPSAAGAARLAAASTEACEP
jgi:hypothetical protein